MKPKAAPKKAKKTTKSKTEKAIKKIMEECEEAAMADLDITLTTDDVFKILMTSATNFCTVLLAEQVDDDEATIRSAEIAVSLFDEVSYQMYRMSHPTVGVKDE